MDRLKEVALSKKPCVSSLRSYTEKEISDLKTWLRSKNIPYQHKTEGLKYNGVLVLNPPPKKAKKVRRGEVDLGMDRQARFDLAMFLLNTCR